MINSLARKLIISAPAFTASMLVFGFILALLLRIQVGGVGVAYSAVAGLIFAGLLGMLAITYGLGTIVSLRSIIIGLSGGALLLFVPFVKNVMTSPSIVPAGNYSTWAITVSIVAVAEEAFLRGALFDVITKWRGQNYAVVIGAILFTVLHIPLYGWHIIPLDFAVGLWLGMLRVISGTWVAPALAHTVADSLSWWLI